MAELPSDRIGRVFFPLMFGGMVIGALLVFGQCVVWLRTGEWPEMPFRWFIGLDTTEWRWRGVAKIADFLGNMNAGFAIMVISLSAIHPFEYLTDRLDGKR